MSGQLTQEKFDFERQGQLQEDWTKREKKRGKKVDWWVIIPGMTQREREREVAQNLK